MDASSLRKEYTSAGLDKADVDPDPIVQFHEWFEKVIDADLHEPNAMILATATADGKPSARTVLLKGYDERGFVFYTNYEGRKAKEIEANPTCALLFYWGELERQVRIEGRASYYDIATKDEITGEAKSEKRVAWHYPDPAPAFEGLKDHVAFYPNRMDACWVGGEKVQAQEGEIYGGWITSDIVGPFKGAPGTWGW